MKKLIFGCLAFLVLVFAAQAQEDPGKALKKAGNALKTFDLDQTANLDKLHEAVDLIAIATAANETMSDPATWQTQGDIYNSIANQIVSVRQLNIGSLDALPKVDDPAMTAFVAYKKALDMAEKKYQSKDALKGIRAVQTNLNNMGIYAYESGEFADAYANFNGVLEAHKLLMDNGMESMLEDETAVNDQMYITGLAALNANEIEAAAPLFEKMKSGGIDKPAIYESLYKIEAAAALDPNSTLSEEEKTALMEKAYANLDEGRKQFPDDVSLLFAEINHFLRINKLDVLITKLESAIQKEPDNISLYTTMGNVYDNLYQTEAGAGNDEKAQEYFDEALNYYNQALEKKPNSSDATYSIGALYFNKAAQMTQELAALNDDYSKEGQRKYDALQTEVSGVFDTALPYFIEVEKMKPNDINTLIALKEIYARKSDYTLSNEFKARLETVQGGGSLESYFKNN
jgi:tetratricopeptide (TPR) repeat protein